MTQIQENNSHNMENGNNYDLFFENKIQRDLELFNGAVKLKISKNNLFDTYSTFLLKNIGFKDEEFIYKAWEKYADDIHKKKIQKNLNFYIHMPYCKTNCTFCVFASTIMKNNQQIEDYLQILIHQMKKFAPIFRGLKFNTFYMGGGTPSNFSAAQFEKLFDTMFSLFEFEESGEKVVEFNPSSTTYEKLQVLKKYNLNRISLGVQSLSERVLKINQRVYQTKRMVKDAIDTFKKLDIEHNADLVLGLKGDTASDFLASFEELCKWGTSSITACPMMTTDKYITHNYKNFQEFEDFYYPFYDEIAKKMFDVANEYGYVTKDKLSYVAPIHFSKKFHNKKSLDYLYAHFSVQESSIFSLGFYSHSRIENFIEYKYVDRNNPNPTFLKYFSTDPNDFLYDVDAVSHKYERVKFIVENFCGNRSIPRVKYKKLYGQDIVSDFTYAIEALKSFNLIKVFPDKIEFSKMDEKLFYPYFLFFIGKENVIEKFPILDDKKLKESKAKLSEALLL